MGWAFVKNSSFNAETAFEDVHDGVVDSLPLVDHLVFVNTDYDVGRAVVLSLALSLVYGLFGEPAIFARDFIFLEKDLAQELDVAAGEQIITAVNVHDALSRLGTGSLDKLSEATPFVLGVFGFGFLRRSPEMHLGAGCLA
ncbi:hypothetical protein HG530_000382 [Fusarium avenaceum]|nr:hypothetical protein HG530_000382 [Fusarium avenaceum]